MKVLLIKDVYNLGRAGEVKKVADGYARNFLLPQKLAVRATTGAVRQVEKIQAAAAKQREILNAEMSDHAVSPWMRNGDPSRVTRYRRVGAIRSG